jgi:hypothetical protein
MSLRARIPVLSLVLLALVIFSPAFAEGDRRGDFPGPVLAYPVGSGIDLSASDKIEFRWEVEEKIKTDYFELTIYLGKEVNPEKFYLSKKISTFQLPLKLAASTFKKGQDYTWSLVQVYNDGRESKASKATFNVENEYGK